MISAADFLQIALTAAGVAVVVGALTLIVLRLMRNASLLAQLLAVTTGATVATVAAAVAIGSEMYLSDHDLVVLCWVVACGAVASIAVAALLGRAVSHSVRALAAAAHVVGDGQVVQAARQQSSELGLVSRELAASSERLRVAREEVAALEQSRRRLVAWISHDLRTPLAALQAMAESLEDGVAEDPSRYFRKIQAQAETLASMVDDLFELSKIEAGALRLNKEPLSLFDLVSDTVADLHPVAEANDVSLREERTGELTIWGDARELSRVVANLLMNAIQHSPPNSEILISARTTDDHRAVLSVSDAGGGIPEKDLGRIFEPGWRADTARTPETLGGRSSGAGMGLAIVRGIVEAHSGRVSVENIPGGTRFDVVLPSAAATAA